MSLLWLVPHFNVIKSNLLNTIVRKTNSGTIAINPTRNFSITVSKLCTNINDINEKLEQPEEDNSAGKAKSSIDRTKIVPVETSIKYLSSGAYKETYGDQPVWVQYRRNHKGMFPPKKTRKTCIRKGVISTGNPCPICRDEYLVLDHRNLQLLQQFISAQTGQVLSYTKTGICQRKHQELLVAVERAMDYGYLTFDVPFRKFDYSEYYPVKA